MPKQLQPTRFLRRLWLSMVWLPPMARTKRQFSSTTEGKVQPNAITIATRMTAQALTVFSSMRAVTELTRYTSRRIWALLWMVISFCLRLELVVLLLFKLYAQLRNVVWPMSIYRYEDAKNYYTPFDCGHLAKAPEQWVRVLDHGGHKDLWLFGSSWPCRIPPQ